MLTGKITTIFVFFGNQTAQSKIVIPNISFWVPKVLRTKAFCSNTQFYTSFMHEHNFHTSRPLIITINKRRWVHFICIYCYHPEVIIQATSSTATFMLMYYCIVDQFRSIIICMARVQDHLLDDHTTQLWQVHDNEPARKREREAERQRDRV